MSNLKKKEKIGKIPGLTRVFEGTSPLLNKVRNKQIKFNPFMQQDSADKFVPANGIRAETFHQDIKVRSDPVIGPAKIM